MACRVSLRTKHGNFDSKLPIADQASSRPDLARSGHMAGAGLLFRYSTPRDLDQYARARHRRTDPERGGDNQNRQVDYFRLGAARLRTKGVQLARSTSTKAINAPMLPRPRNDRKRSNMPAFYHQSIPRAKS
jgi:hypothetical protein